MKRTIWRRALRLRHKYRREIVVAGLAACGAISAVWILSATGRPLSTSISAARMEAGEMGPNVTAEEQDYYLRASAPERAALLQQRIDRQAYGAQGSGVQAVAP